MKSSGLEIAPEDLTIVRGILASLAPGREVRAFGSRVCGGARRFSDLDLAIFGDSPLPLDELSDLREAFSGSELPFTVDIVDWHALPARFREGIEAEYRILQTAP